jgi:hypothetical protein
MQPSPSEDSERRKEQQGTFSQAGYSHSPPYPQQQQQSQTRADPFNMNPLGSSLPDLSYQAYGQLPPQRYAPGPSSSGLVYQLPNAPQFAGAQGLNPSGNSPYNVPYQGQYQGIYAPGNTPSPPHLQSSTSPTNQFYHNQGFIGQQPGSPYFMQSNQYNPQSQMYSTVPSQYGSRNSFSGDPRLQGQQRANEYLGVNYVGGGTGRPSSISKYSSNSVYFAILQLDGFSG